MDTPYTPPAVPPTTPPKTSGLAITSLVLGCLSLLGSCITGIPAVIFGHVALSKIKKSGDAIGGRGIAIAGLVLGYLFSAFAIIYAGLAVPTAMKALDKANEVTVINNVRSVKASLDVYASSNSGSYPALLSDLVPTIISDQASLDQITQVNLGGGKFGTLNYLPGYTQRSPSDSIILYSPETKSGSIIVGRVDSSVMRQKAAAAKADLAKQGISLR